MTKKSEVKKPEPTEPVAEVPEQSVTQASARKSLPKAKASDVVIFVVIIAIIIGLVVFIIGRINLKNEVNQAKTTSDKVIAAMATQDTTTVRSLGDKQFQAKNTAQELNENLTSTDQDGSRVTFAELYGKTKPTISQQVVANNDKGQHVAVIYRYDRLKVPFYVRIDVTKAPGSDKWQLQALSASPDESKLLGQ